MFRKPVLKARKCDGPRLFESAGSEPAYPVVGNVEGRSNFAVTTDRRFNRIPGFFDAPLNNHVLLLS